MVPLYPNFGQVGPKTNQVSDMFRIYRPCICGFNTISKKLHAFTKSDIMPFYAVRAGRKPGIYLSWNDCKAQVDQFPQARYKKFNTEQEAQQFIQGTSSTPYKAPWSATNSSKCNTGGVKANIGPSVNARNNGTSSNDAELASLRSQLALKETELKVLEKEHEVEILKQKISQLEHTNKSQKKTWTGHHSKPYSRPSSTAVPVTSLRPVESSASWKQNRTTQFISAPHTSSYHTSSTINSSHKPPGHAEVYTDGACSNNGQGNPQAGIGVYWGEGHPLNVSDRLKGRQTNNRAEIHAVIKAVKQAKQEGITELTVNTDSQFLVSAMTSWVHGWKKNGWKTSDRKPVKNRTDFESLLKNSQGIKINYNHVRGHQGHHGNEQADTLAVEGSRKPYRFRTMSDGSASDES